MNFIAHRGKDNHSYKENSKDAILNSLNKNYIDGVEFDVRITKDSQIIIRHNALIDLQERYLDVIKNKNLDEIKKIYPNICTLEDILINVQNKKILLIEIKEESDNFDKLIIKLFNILKKHKHLNIYLCSFNYKLMKKIKHKYKKYKCGLIIGYLKNLKNIDKEFDFFLYGYNYIDYINYNKEIFIFNINKKEQLKLINKKIKTKKYIISDKSYLLI